MKPKLWRGFAHILEQTNGYYSVQTSERWDNGDQEGEKVSYHNLSWSEANDVVGAFMEDSGERRRLHHTLVLLPPWQQLSLLGIEVDRPSTMTP